MPRVYLPLLPIPVLAVIVAFSACSRRSEEPVTQVIPPPAPYAAAPIANARPPIPQPAPPVADDAPSDEEVKAFERKIAK